MCFSTLSSYHSDTTSSLSGYNKTKEETRQSLVLISRHVMDEQQGMQLDSYVASWAIVALATYRTSLDLDTN